MCAIRDTAIGQSTCRSETASSCRCASESTFRSGYGGQAPYAASRRFPRKRGRGTAPKLAERRRGGGGQPQQLNERVLNFPLPPARVSACGGRWRMRASARACDERGVATHSRCLILGGGGGSTTPLQSPALRGGKGKRLALL